MGIPRELSQAEVQTFLSAHPDIAYALSGTYNEARATMRLVIPDHGLVVKDGARYVLVWIDAMGRNHFIADIESLPQFAEITQNKPAYFSPDSSFVENVFEEMGKVGAQAAAILATGLKVAVAIAIVFVVVELAQVAKLSRA